MKYKGEARFIFTDEAGNVLREEVRSNFLFEEGYIRLATTDTPYSIVIYEPDNDTYPLMGRSNSRHYSQSIRYLEGTLPQGRESMVFYQKTDKSPAYVELYSLFQPGASDRTIRAIGLSRTNPDFSAINLEPPCIQRNTEYLNIYYRIILIDDGSNEVSEYVRDLYLKDITTTQKTFIQSRPELHFYPWQIKQDLSDSGWINKLSPTRRFYSPSNTINAMNKPGVEKYQTNIKLEYFPDAAPNQYKQFEGDYLNTIVHGTTYNGINQKRFVKPLGSNNTGIGNVFGSAPQHNTFLFDPTKLPVGTGRMYAGGLWAPVRASRPSKFVATITKTGQTLTESEYILSEYFDSPSAVISLLPTFQYSSGRYVQALSSNQQYKKDRTHFFGYVEGAPKTQGHAIPYIEDEKFILANETGISIVDWGNGLVTPFDIDSTPALPVTALKDVCVDKDMNIWVACAHTGLWKLHIDWITDTKTLSHISSPPGCQPKVYALAADNFGTVYAIWHGLGLHWTKDGGLTWVNAIINYPMFSEADEGGTNSRWRFVQRLLVNPHRDAANGNAQLLMLAVEDYNSSAGCWYDQISANTTGITNGSLKQAFEFVRNKPNSASMHACSKYTDKWHFASAYHTSSETTPDNLSVNGAWSIAISPFGGNAAPSYKPTGVYGTRTYYRESFDPDNGDNHEIIEVCGAIAGSTSASASPLAPVSLDYNSFALFSIKKGYTIATTNSAFQQDSATSLLCKIGRNAEFVALNYSSSDGTTYYSSPSILQIVEPTRNFKLSIADFYGWDGNKWVKNLLSSKRCHDNYQPLLHGVQNRFVNDTAATTSFSAGDRYVFTCFDGYFKDNSSKVYLNDTIYIRPTELVEQTTPAVVTKVDASRDVGVLNNSIIEQDWDVTQLPDLSLNGGEVITDGDETFAAVRVLYPLYEGTENNNHAKTGNKFTSSLNLQLSNVSMVWPDGTSKRVFVPSSDLYYDKDGSGENWVTSNEYTFEGWVYLNSHQENVLMGFGSEQNAFSFGVNRNGQLYLSESRSNNTWGNVGQAVPLRQWVHIAATISRQNLSLYLNGVAQAAVTADGINANVGNYSIGASVQKTSRWSNNDNFTKSTLASPVPNYPNLPVSVLNGFGDRPIIDSITNYSGRTLSVYAKTTSPSYPRIDIGGASFQLTGAGSTDRPQYSSIEAVGDGWYRIASWEQGVPLQIKSQYYVALCGPMLHVGAGAQPFTLDPTVNLIADAVTIHKERNVIDGYVADARMTEFIRYKGNFTVPQSPFKAYGNVYEGANIKFGSTHKQGGIVSRKKLIGDWWVLFQDLPETFSKENIGGNTEARPHVMFGITTSPVIHHSQYLDYRVFSLNTDNSKKMMFQTFDSSVYIGQNRSVNNNTSNYYIDKIPKHVLFQKKGNTISVSYDFGSGFEKYASYQDNANVHYVGMWLERPFDLSGTEPTLGPAVNIFQNGSACVAQVGDALKQNGVFGRHFKLTDSYWSSDFEILLDGVPAKKKRTETQDPGDPLEGEVYLHPNGSLRFNEADIGKKITGKFMVVKH